MDEAAIEEMYNAVQDYCDYGGRRGCSGCRIERLCDKVKGNFLLDENVLDEAFKIITSTSDEEIELRPCPFCGGAAEYFEERMYFVANALIMGVRCTRCGGSLTTTDKSKCPNDVMSVWNRRVYGQSIKSGS